MLAITPYQSVSMSMVIQPDVQKTSEVRPIVYKANEAQCRLYMECWFRAISNRGPVDEGSSEAGVMSNVHICAELWVPG